MQTFYFITSNHYKKLGDIRGKTPIQSVARYISIDIETQSVHAYFNANSVKAVITMTHETHHTYLTHLN